jgi:hypothetical protein
MNFAEYRQIIVNSYSGFTCGILPNLDCCSGCQYLLANKNDITVDCEIAQDFADALLKVLPTKIS